MDIREIVRLTRFEHALMLALAVLIGEVIVLGGFPKISEILVLSLLVPIFSEMGSFALNDYLDIETDRRNRKMDRPLVKGTISAPFALYFSASSLAVSVILAFFINWPAFLIALIFNILATLYNWRLKDLPLVGNIYIALTMAIPFIFGNFVYRTEFSQLALVLAVLGFLAGLAREIVKSVQDMEGDIAARRSRTIPVVIGKKPSVALASLLYILFIPLSVLPFFIGLAPSAPSLSLVGIADALILGIVFRISDGTDASFRFARNASLVAFFLGMMGLLVAAL